MTTKIEPYLFFDGDCAEAMRFYERVIGGKLEAILKYSEAPPGAAMETECDPEREITAPPEEWADRVMHASLLIDGVRVMASDSPPGLYEKPAGVSISIGVETVEEAGRIFEQLSEGGKVLAPMGETFWAGAFGMVIDRFGTSWMVGGAPKPMG